MSKFSSEIREKARQLYLQGKKPGEIATAISTEYNQQCRPSTIYSWIEKSGWDDELAAIKTQAIIPIANQQKNLITADVKKRLIFYGDVLTVIREKIEEAKTLGIPLAIADVDDFSKMVKAADIAAQGERREQMGIFTVQFINDVLAVLLEEVKDELLLQKIAVKLRRVAMQYQ